MYVSYLNVCNYLISHTCGYIKYSVYAFPFTVALQTAQFITRVNIYIIIYSYKLRAWKNVQMTYTISRKQEIHYDVTKYIYVCSSGFADLVKYTYIHMYTHTYIHMKMYVLSYYIHMYLLCTFITWLAESINLPDVTKRDVIFTKQSTMHHLQITL